ncbi:hypothetical protein SY88_17175 [Clostridiales bacterium PH28_bin88]|nr:hypothetical protein SY88_17175 [Clostridiales bacterium PH28_bin88]
MLRLRRLVGFLTLICLLITFISPAVAASVSVTTLPAGVFLDVPAGHWAEKDIAKMKAKGVVAGVTSDFYSPNSTVTREQLVVMLLRVMDMVKDSWGKQMPASFKNPERVSSWARDQVAYAVEKGIIAGQDLENFRPADGANRYEVAVFITRAMGLEAEAAALSNTVLPYTDARNIPAWAVGYVAVMRNRNIMSGNSDGSFGALNAVTRAQVASIMARVDGQVKKLAAAETRGEVFSVSPADRSLILTLSGAVSVTVQVATDALIFKDNKKVDLLQLQRGDKVLGVPGASGALSYVEVLKPEDFTFSEVTVKGVIKSVTTTGLASVVVSRTEGGETAFSLDAATQIYAGTQRKAVSDLAAGQEVELITSGTKAVRIDILNVERQVEGTLKSVDTTGGSPRITLIMADRTESTYSLAAGGNILLDWKKVTVQELYPGQKVEATVRGTAITLLQATSIEWELTGTLLGVSFAPREAIRVEKKDGTVESFPVAADVRVRRQSSTVTLRDIYSGDEVELLLKNGTVTRIYASQVDSEVKGRIQAITLATNPKVTIVLSDGTEKTYTLASGAKIRRGSQYIQLSSVQVNSLATLKVSSGFVTEMDVEVRTSMEYIIGAIENINSTAKVLVIRENNTNNLKEVYIKSSADFIKFGYSLSFSGLKIGDEVIAVGKVESGIFMSSLVVVVASSES